MRQRILNHGSFLVILSVLLTFLAASFVMYDKFDVFMKQSVRDEVEYIRAGIEAAGLDYLESNVKEINATRITVTDNEGNVLYDSETEADQLENHGERPEFVKAKEKGYGEIVRFSETFSEQTFYCAMKLDNGNILRVARTTDSVFLTLFSSFTLLGILMLGILALEFFLVQRQTKELIAPINELDLEHPLKDVRYEELRPLLVRVDQQNKQIASQLEELKEAEAMRREFSANVSHELKTPLMSISGYAELIETGLASGKDIKRFSQEICKNSERMQGLITDILHLSELDSSDGEIEKTPLDLKKLAEDTRDLLQMTAEQYQVDVITDGKPQIVACNRRMMDELVYNLCDNAIRYNEPGGKVWIHTGETDGRAYLAVQDTGIGIREEEQDRIFERFYRVDKSRSRQTGGTGLGLAIVKHIAALHRAEILIDSKLGVGTTIEIRFPSQKEGGKS